MKYIGIDIGKSSFVAAFPKVEGYTTATYTNDVDGVAMFLAQFDKLLHHCVLEATGNYGALLVEMLLEAELAVSVINPKQIKHFAKVIQYITKTDKVNAQLIALYSSKLEPQPYKISSESIQALNQQKTLVSQLKKQLTMSYNLLESFSVLPKTDDIALKILKANIISLEQQITLLEEQMLAITKENYNKLYSHSASDQNFLRMKIIACIYFLVFYTNFKYFLAFS